MRSNREATCHPLVADFPRHSRYTERCWMRCRRVHAAWGLDHDTDSYEKISHAFLDGWPSGGLTRDRIVDNITLYWLTNTATPSARLYCENFRTVAAAIASGQKPPKLLLPVAYTVFH